MAQWVPPPLPVDLIARRRSLCVGRAAELAVFDQAWERVEAEAEPFHAPMEMRPGDPSGCADTADQLSGGHRFAFAHLECRQMCEQREKSQPVIDDDGVA